MSPFHQNLNPEIEEYETRLSKDEGMKKKMIGSYFGKDWKGSLASVRMDRTKQGFLQDGYFVKDG